MTSNLVVATTTAHNTQKSARPFQRLRSLNAQAADLDLRRRTRNLAEGLMISLSIAPYERNLVVWLGDSASHNNQDAVEHWVSQTLKSQQLDIRTVDPKQLRRSLVQHLESLREEMP